jgi:uncharacterized OB-fold protein
VIEETAAVYDDALTAPFWESAARREFVLQQCEACGQYQFYPRPFCMRCDCNSLLWVRARGTGYVHSMTVVHVSVIPELRPPYTVALVRLDEGPLFTADILGEQCTIGDRVEVAWRDREGAPPFPAFRRVPSGGDP